MSFVGHWNFFLLYIMALKPSKANDRPMIPINIINRYLIIIINGLSVDCQQKKKLIVIMIV